MRPLIGITGRKDTSARLLSSPMHCVGETYVRAIHKVGGTPIILPPVMVEEDWPAILTCIDGLLLSGGEDIDPVYYGQEPEAWLGGVDEERDNAEQGLVALAVEYEVPILGICRGHQVLNVALGGTLYQDIAAHIPNALEHAYIPGHPMNHHSHSVTIDPEAALATILGGTVFNVNSAHHQTVKELGSGLKAVAYASDGVIEALEMPDHSFCLSVQWHPEAMVPTATEMWPLFKAFVDAARELSVPF